MTNMLRWTATVTYHTGQVNIFQIDELEDLQDIVENGPDFSYLKKITVTYNYGK